MKEFRRFLRANRIFWILPLVVFVIALGLALFIVSRPILGSAIYRP